MGGKGWGGEEGGGANNFCSVKTKMSLKCPIIENEVDMQRNVSDIIGARGVTFYGLGT